MSITKLNKRRTLSVVIPTYNCAYELRKCLRSVQWADEIIVVDMYSTDGTVDVAEKFSARIYRQFPFEENFDLNRKFGMERAKGDWILKLDSDEVLSLKLQAEIRRFLLKDDDTYSGLNLCNKIFMFGRRINHGPVKSNSHELRLVRNKHWHYEPYRFHQLISVDGKVGFLNNYYSHYNFKTVSQFVNKMNKYTNLDAKYYLKKMPLIMVILAPIKTFLKLFFWQMGFLDGQVGFVVCMLFATYSFVEKTKIWEQQNL